MSGIGRRAAMRLLAGAPFAVGYGLSASSLLGARVHVSQAAENLAAGTAYQPEFFSAHEWETVHLLVDLIIPADERSGSATEAGVPEFMDFILNDPEAEERALEQRQVSMRGGLAWIDRECHRRFDALFVACTERQRVELLDDIAFADEEEPMRVPVDLQIVEPEHGAAFFSSFRDLTASGFWSSRMGVEDLQFMGNVPNLWTGPPPEVLRKLGLEPEE